MANQGARPKAARLKKTPHEIRDATGAAWIAVEIEVVDPDTGEVLATEVHQHSLDGPPLSREGFQRIVNERKAFFANRETNRAEARGWLESIT